MSTAAQTPARDNTPAPLVDEQPEASGYDLFVEEDLLVEEVSIDGMCGVY
ncbi:mycofactocin precursor MftA [Streptomyces sp. NBC_01352]|uniref:Mycofactocin n=1 Tax=Streptomyces plumbiresistens TaxID=511811 RepID=A0ABP7SAL2_9ACTN|nr:MULTISPECIES: mycofactocin precursor MftA [unclassified Streptomyces]MCX4705396.1 mycofactocin precursor MftA [Streptomyces sp. NBC_01373]